LQPFSGNAGLTIGLNRYLFAPKMEINQATQERALLMTEVGGEKVEFGTY
jgi:hypothetical protein